MIQLKLRQPLDKQAQVLVGVLLVRHDRWPWAVLEHPRDRVTQREARQARSGRQPIQVPLEEQRRELNRGTPRPPETKDDGEVFLSCRADNDCVLTPTPVGEEQVTGQSFANLVQTEVITFEFTMDPVQHHVALLPEVLDELVIDFKHQTDAGSLFRPAMELRLILGENVNDWSFEATNVPDLASTTYTLENEQLDLSAGRVLWEDEPVRLVFSVTLDRPGNWALNMRGASYLSLNVPWSIDAQEANLDEPSSKSPAAT